MHKSEKEKMLAGEIYNPMDEELTRLRFKSRKLSRQFNSTDDPDEILRREILNELLGAFGESSELLPTISFDYGFNTFIGNNCFFNFNTTFLDCAEIKIGSRVLVGPNCSFMTPIHPMLYSERTMIDNGKGGYYEPEYAKAIVVGDDCWIGGNVTIIGGVSIGAKSVIGAGSVVTKNIPEGVFAAGVPCKVIRKINEEDTIL